MMSLISAVVMASPPHGSDVVALVFAVILAAALALLLPPARLRGTRCPGSHVVEMPSVA